MNIRMAVLALAGTTLVSTAALAASGSTNHPASRLEMGDRCATLESQYNDALTRHPQAARLDRAERLGSAGTSECRSDQGDIGVHKLEQALIDLGVKPAV